MNVLVKNLNGTAGKSHSPYSSWLEYWKSKTGKTAYSCSNKSCNGKSEVGGHVKKTTEGSHYLTPLCYSCNNSGSDKIFEVNSSDLLKLN